jgi:hypothetical protein
VGGEDGLKKGESSDTSRLRGEADVSTLSTIDWMLGRGEGGGIRIAPEGPGSFPLLRPRLKILLDGDLLLSERLLPSLSTVFSTTRRRPEVEVSRDLSPSSSRPRAWGEVSGIGGATWAG